MTKIMVVSSKESTGTLTPIEHLLSNSSDTFLVDTEEDSFKSKLSLLYWEVYHQKWQILYRTIGELFPDNDEFLEFEKLLISKKKDYDVPVLDFNEYNNTVQTVFDKIFIEDQKFPRVFFFNVEEV